MKELVYSIRSSAVRGAKRAGLTEGSFDIIERDLDKAGSKAFVVVPRVAGVQEAPPMKAPPAVDPAKVERKKAIKAAAEAKRTSKAVGEDLDKAPAVTHQPDGTSHYVLPEAPPTIKKVLEDPAAFVEAMRETVIVPKALPIIEAAAIAGALASILSDRGMNPPSLSSEAYAALPRRKVSTMESPTKTVWEITQAMRKRDPNVRRRDIVAVCVQVGGAWNMVRTQVQRCLQAMKESDRNAAKANARKGNK